MYRKQIDTLALECRAVVAPMLQVQHLQDEMDRMRFTKEDLRNHANAVGADIPQEVEGCLALSARTFWTQHFRFSTVQHVCFAILHPSLCLVRA